MMKKMIALFLGVFILASMVSCKATQDTEMKKEIQGSGYPYTFSDSTGTKITLNQKPEKVAVLFSSYADMWITAGGTVDVTVGETVKRGFADKNAILVDAGAGHSTIDRELLIESKPDFVIGTADYATQNDAVAFCRSAGIPAATFTVESFEDYLSLFGIMCNITGNDESYKTNGTDISERIGKMKSTISQAIHDKTTSTPCILLVRSGSSEKSTKAKNSKDNFVCSMLAEMGAYNLADTKNTLTSSLSLEAMVEGNPDYLFITTMGDEDATKSYMESLLKSDGWKELDCVKNGNYLYLPKDLFHFKPNARWDMAYEYLAKILFPEISFE